MMQSEKEKLAALWKQLQNAGSLDDLRGLLQSAGNGNITDHDTQTSLQFLRLDVFRAAMQLTVGDHGKAGTFITDLLLPACLNADPGEDPETALYCHQARNILADWIGQYSDPARAELRKPIYECLTNAAKGNDPSPATWTVASLGYRCPESRDLLRKLQRRDDDSGDAALCAEAAMGCPISVQQMLTREVLARFKRRPQANFNLAIQELADPKFISVLVARNSAKDEVLRQSLLGRIAAAHRGSGTVLRAVWQATEKQFDKRPEAIGAFLLTGAMAAECNLPEVTITLLSLLARNGISHFHIYNCLEKCVLPAQLRGWRKGLSREGIAVLRKDAASSAGGDGPGISLEQRIKQLAWETALCAGLSETAEWLDDAVKNEKNPHVIGSVAGQAAFISLSQIPTSVRDWAKRDINMEGGKNVAEFIAANGALQIVASVASPEALAALLHTGLRVHGEHLHSTAELVEDVSCWLAGSGKIEVVDVLLHEVVAGSGSAAGRLAISGLRALAINGFIGGELANSLLGAAHYEGWPNYARARLIETIGHLPFATVPEDVTESVMKWTKSEDSPIKWASIEAAVRLGIFPERGGRSIAKLELAESNTGTRPEGAAGTMVAGSYVLSMLLEKGGAEFARSAIEVVKAAPMASAWALLNNIDATLPAPVLDKLALALRDRILKVQTSASAEVGLFLLLAKLGPLVILDENWEWSTWLPNARAALADAVGAALEMLQSTSIGEARAEKVTDRLQKLLGDGVYAVRRAAARSLAKTGDGGYLTGICEKWVQSGATELQKRAAEAAVWLPAKDARVILGRLSAAPEREVREAAARARKERIGKYAAAHCMKRLLPIRFKPSDNPTKWVLDRYRFGRAITQLGDDNDLRKISEAAQAARRLLPPNINHWLRRLVKDLEEQWTTSARKWPEPWLPWQGSVEEFDGEAVISANGKTHDRYKVHYALWRRYADSPREASSWGGSMKFSSRPPLAAFFGAKDLTAVIAVPGREEARVLISQCGANTTWLICGNGNYPFKKAGLI